MRPFTIALQQNATPENYVYEQSVNYITTACFQVALKLDLVNAMPSEGISFSDFSKKFELYDETSLKELMEFLRVRSFFREENGLWYSTPLLFALEELKSEIVSEGLWKASYNVIDYLVHFPKKLQSLSIVQKSIDPVTHCLSLQSDKPVALVLELSRGYILTRALRQFTRLGCFEFLIESVQEESTLIDYLTQEFLKKTQKDSPKLGEKTYLLESVRTAIQKLLCFLEEYQFLSIDHDRKVSLTQYGALLNKAHVNTLYPVMLMIGKEWWNSCSGFALQFDREEKNQQESLFYQQKPKRMQRFAAGMAALSKSEDVSIAETISKVPHFSDYQTVIDIGGGEASLLYQLYLRNPEKTYVLFERLDSETGQARVEQIGRIRQRCAEKYGQAFSEKLTITMGNFQAGVVEQIGIPRYDNALYSIKCCLHNYSKQDAQHIVKNIRKSMGDQCRLVVSERTLPLTENNVPHKTHCSNLLMVMLFKSSPHDTYFYKNVLQSAGFNCELEQITYCDGYGLFSALPTPSLDNQSTLLTPTL